MADARREQAFDQEAAERRAAETAGRVKDEFLAVMSHELKHPLNLIHVNAELLSRMPELAASQPVRRAAEAIRGAVESQARIIDDLLDLSRARTGKMALTLVRTPIDPIVRRIADVAKGDAQQRGVALELHIEGDVDFTVACDPVRVEQIVWNLVSNAIKFTRPGDRIDIRLCRREAFARLEVADTGAGVAKAFLPNVFSMFQQERRRGAAAAAWASASRSSGSSRSCTAAGPRRTRKASARARRSPSCCRSRRRTRPSRAPARRRAARCWSGMKVLAVDDMAEVARAVRRAAAARRGPGHRGGQRRRRRWNGSRPSRSTC